MPVIRNLIISVDVFDDKDYFRFQVLEYTLRKNHPDKKNILADTLLVLPMLRESAVANKECMEKTRDRVDPQVAPLVCEMLQG